MARADVGDGPRQAHLGEWEGTPPEMSDDLYESFANSAQFQALPQRALARTESPQDVLNRTAEFYREQMIPALLSRQTILVVTHSVAVGALFSAISSKSQTPQFTASRPFLLQFDRSLRTIGEGQYIE
jgi:bisphosphoglycerate-dependent phosphoglycerate mutase